MQRVFTVNEGSRRRMGCAHPSLRLRMSFGMPHFTSVTWRLVVVWFCIMFGEMYSLRVGADEDVQDWHSSLTRSVTLTYEDVRSRCPKYTALV